MEAMDLRAAMVAVEELVVDWQFTRLKMNSLARFSHEVDTEFVNMALLVLPTLSNGLTTRIRLGL